MSELVVRCPRRNGAECETPNVCCGGGECRLGPDIQQERRTGHSRLQYDKATRTVVTIDPIAAAERAVIEAAIRWRQSIRPGRTVWPPEPNTMSGEVLIEYQLARRQLDHVVGELLRLRAEARGGEG